MCTDLPRLSYLYYLKREGSSNLTKHQFDLIYIRFQIFIMPLRLSNKVIQNKIENLCFVNCVLQLLGAVEEFRTFFSSALPLWTESQKKTPVACELSRIFSSRRVISAWHLRSMVSIYDNKPYLSNGEQQDAEEFLRSLFNVLEKEFKLINSTSGLDLLNKFHGIEQTEKWFEKECKICHYKPENRSVPFFNLTLFIVDCGNKNLQNLIDDHFHQLETLQMRCACVPHKPNSNVFKKTHVDKEPKYLVIELRRYLTREDSKSTNTIHADQQIFLKSHGNKYELASVIDHDGLSISGGHYTAQVYDGKCWTNASEFVLKLEIA